MKLHDGYHQIKITAIIVFVFMLAIRPPLTLGVEKPETPHLVFVTEYIRELAAIENIRASASQEPKQDTASAFSNAIHASTLLQLELGSQIKMLKDMHLNSPFEELIPSIILFDQHRISAYQRIIDISTAFLSGPKPGVDYGKLSAEMSKVRAEVDYVDKALFEATPVIFATLIDPKTDSKNHASHLIITSAERTKLIDNLKTKFGSKLDQKDQNYTVSAATVLRDYLLKDFKSSDEPWE
jgi:hypothetical protein